MMNKENDNSNEVIIKEKKKKVIKKKKVTKVPIPQTINNKSAFLIKKIACGGTHTLALTNSGAVLSWGTGSYGQLGLSNQYLEVPTPTLINFPNKELITHIYAGLNHSMAITSEGKVYSWGDGTNGQLGYRANKQYIPKMIDELKKKTIIKGALGSDNSCGITKLGNVFLWGSNTNNKLGLGKNDPFIIYPEKNPSLKKIVKISLGAEHSMAIDSKGNLFSWGNGTYGQLGLGELLSRDKPEIIKGDKNNIKFIPTKIKCGSFQSLALDTEGHAYICGKDIINLSITQCKHKDKFEIIDDVKGIFKGLKIACGYGNSLILNAMGQVLGFGDNTYYKAGGDHEVVDMRPVQIPFSHDGQSYNIIKIFAGYQTCFAINKVDEVFAWGCPWQYALTKNFGKDISRVPLMINIEWHSNEFVEEGGVVTTGRKDNNETLEKEELYSALLNESMKIESFGEIFNIIIKLGNEFLDDVIIEKDTEREKEFIELFTKLPYTFDTPFKKVESLFIDIDQLSTFRLREIKPPLQKDKLFSLLNRTEIKSKKVFSNNETSLIEIFYKNIDEIEKLLSYFFIHPCSMKPILQSINENKLDCIINALKNIYRGINSKQRSDDEEYIILNFIALFRISFIVDYSNNQEHLNKFFGYKTDYMIVHLLNRFFYDYFESSALIDYFETSFIKLKEFCLGGDECATYTYAKKLYSLLFFTNIDTNYNINLSLFKHVFELYSSFYDEINTKIPIIFNEYFAYCFHFMLKYIERTQVEVLLKEKKQTRLLIDSLVNRLFYGHLIGRNIKYILTDRINRNILWQKLHFEKGSSLEKTFEMYLKIISELFERISSNEHIKYDANSIIKNNKTNNIGTNIEEAIKAINEMITKHHNQLHLKEKIPIKTLKYKNAVYRYMVSFHLNIKPFKVNFDFITLFDFLEYLSTMIKCLPSEGNYSVISFFANNPEKISKIREEIRKDPEKAFKTIKLSLDVKYLINPTKYIERYEKELNIVYSQIQFLKEKNTFCRCTDCNLVLPSYFPKKDKYTNKFFYTFTSKVKKQLMFYISTIFLNSNFNKQISTLEEFEKSTKKFLKNLENSNSTDLKEYKYLVMLSDYLEEIKARCVSTKKTKKIILQDFQTHLRTKIVHAFKMKDTDSILKHIKKSIESFNVNLDEIGSSFEECKSKLKNSENSINIYDNLNQVRKKMTRSKIKYRLLTEDGLFKYKPTEYNLTYLKNSLILFSNVSMPIKDQDICLEIKADLFNKYFDLKFKNKKTKE